MGNTGSADGDEIHPMENRGLCAIRPMIESVVPCYLDPSLSVTDPSPLPAPVPTAAIDKNCFRVPSDDPHVIRRRDELSDVIRVKLETQTNFGTLPTMTRTLVRLLSDHDRDKTGYLNQKAFSIAMATLNILGPREPEAIAALFAQYDEDCLNFLDYHAFAIQLVGSRPLFLSEIHRVPKGMDETKALALVRSSMMSACRGGAGGLHRLRILLWRADGGSGKLDSKRFLEILDEELRIGDRLDRSALLRVIGTSSPDIIVTDLSLARLRGGRMARAREQAVRNRFVVLASNTTRNGTAAAAAAPILFIDSEILEAYSDVAGHPDVQSGRLAPEEAEAQFSEIVHGFTAGRADLIPGTVSWRAFLEYHRDLSACVVNDDVFFKAIENMWVAPPLPSSLLTTALSATVANAGCQLPGKKVDTHARRSEFLLSTRVKCRELNAGRGTIPPRVDLERYCHPGDYYYIHGEDVPMEGEPMKSNHGSFGEPRRVTCTGPRVPQSLLLDGIVPQYQEKRKEKNNYKGAGIKPGEKPVKLCFRRASLPWRGGGAVPRLV